jgi:hypothetical protein
MYCRKCGNQIGDEDAFCERCGAPRRQEMTQPNPAARPETPSGRGSTDRQVAILNPYAGKSIQIVGGLLIAVGLLAMGYSCIGYSASNEPGATLWGLVIGGVVAITGIVLSAIGKFQHWYHAE